MAAYGLGAQLGVLLPYSRTQESEADPIGLLLMARAGYDPREALAFWQRMEKASSGGGPPEFMSTHPSHGTREQQIQAWLPRRCATTTRPRAHPRRDSLRRCARPSCWCACSRAERASVENFSRLRHAHQLSACILRRPSVKGSLSQRHITFLSKMRPGAVTRSSSRAGRRRWGGMVFVAATASAKRPRCGQFLELSPGCGWRNAVDLRKLDIGRDDGEAGDARDHLARGAATPQAELPVKDYEAWIEPLKAARWAPGELTLETPSGFFREWWRRHWMPALETAVCTVSGHPTTVLLAVNERLDVPAAAVRTPLRPADPLTEPPPSRYSFDNFVVGASNRVAFGAAQAVVAQPGARFNPLFIHSSSGLGKTHLLSAITSALAPSYRRGAVLFVSAENFVNEMIARARGSRQMARFRNRFRGVDTLVVDDSSFWVGSGARRRSSSTPSMRCTKGASRSCWRPTGRRTSCPVSRTRFASVSGPACSPTSTRPIRPSAWRSSTARHERSASPSTPTWRRIWPTDGAPTCVSSRARSSASTRTRASRAGR